MRFDACWNEFLKSHIHKFHWSKTPAENNTRFMVNCAKYVEYVSQALCTCPFRSDFFIEIRMHGLGRASSCRVARCCVLHGVQPHGYKQETVKTDRAVIPEMYAPILWFGGLDGWPSG